MVDNFIIKTDKSFLTNYTFEKLDLLNECIEFNISSSDFSSLELK